MQTNFGGGKTHCMLALHHMAGGTVMISPDRPAREIHEIVEAIVEQLTTLPGSEVSLKLEIDAEVPSGLDRAKVRTLIENANTPGFIDKSVK